MEFTNLSDTGQEQYDKVKLCQEKSEKKLDQFRARVLLQRDEHGPGVSSFHRHKHKPGSQPRGCATAGSDFVKVEIPLGTVVLFH